MVVLLVLLLPSLQDPLAVQQLAASLTHLCALLAELQQHHHHRHHHQQHQLCHYCCCYHLSTGLLSCCYG